MPKNFESGADEFRAEFADVKSAEEIIGKSHDEAAVEDFFRGQKKRQDAWVEGQKRLAKFLKAGEPSSKEIEEAIMPKKVEVVHFKK